MKRLIVTDSTSDLSVEAAKRLGVRVIPVNIILDGKTYLDRTQIKIQDFYKNFDHYQTMATAPVSYEQYAYFYLEFAGIYDEIICIHCSRHLSKTLDNAVKVHADFKHQHKARVAVIDSRQCGMGLGMLVIEAARAMHHDLPFDEIVNQTVDLAGRITTYMTVPTLKYLKANKKIGGLKSFFANALGIKPVLGFNNGKIVVKTKLTSKSDNLLLDMLDYIKRDIGEEPVTMALVHARETKYVNDLKTIFNKRFNVRKLYTTYFGPSIGISTGPETMGVAFFKHPSDV